MSEYVNPIDNTIKELRLKKYRTISTGELVLFLFGYKTFQNVTEM